jgi:N-acetylneuraminate 9-O-acetyltransferase
VFFTGFGQTLSLRSKGASDPIGKMAIAVLRINLLCALLACSLGQPYMLYYICPMHTLWTGIVIALHLPNSWLPAAWQRYAIVISLTTLVWHSRSLFDGVFGWMGPLVAYEGSTYEWWFRSKLDAYSALAGCLLAEARPWIEAHLARHDSMPWVMGRASALCVVLGLHSYYILGMPDRVAYNGIHPYTVALPLVGALLLRNCGSWLRARHSWLLGAMGRHSLELYLLQVCYWRLTCCI